MADIAVVFAKVSRVVNEPIIVELLGGEPLLYPHIEQLLAVLKRANVAQINIYTNLTIPLKYCPAFNGAHIIASLHELSDDQYDKFFDNIGILKHNGASYHVKVMVPNDAILARLKELDVPYYISTIYDAATEDYNQPVTDTAEFVLNGVKVSASDIFEGNLNHFKGYKCFINSVYIDADGFSYKHCSDLRCHYKDPQFIKLLAPYVICQHDRCNSVCKLVYTKIKESASGTSELRQTSNYRTGIS